MSPSERQYKKRISQWHIDKNIKDSEIRFMAQMQVKRALEDKETNFRVRGRDVDPEKISRAVKRKKLSDEDLLAMPAARKYLLYLAFMDLARLTLWISNTIRYKL
jgi:hypothetical protein